MKTGVELIAAERERQIFKEGWSHEHDDGHVEGELAQAAACYAAVKNRDQIEWPWTVEDCRPGNDRIRELVKAGALIAAEIDRLQRLEALKGKK